MAAQQREPLPKRQGGEPDKVSLAEYLAQADAAAGQVKPQARRRSSEDFFMALRRCFFNDAAYRKFLCSFLLLPPAMQAIPLPTRKRRR